MRPVHQQLEYVPPCALHVPPEREEGADPFKLSVQMQEYGNLFDEMPPVEVTLGADGQMMLNNGVTRATRCCLLRPDALIPAQVIDTRPLWDFSHLPTIGETLP